MSERIDDLEKTLTKLVEESNINDPNEKNDKKTNLNKPDENI